MEEAMHLNDQVTDALQRYMKLRSGVTKGAPVEGDSEDSSDSDDSGSSSDSE